MRKELLRSVGGLQLRGWERGIPAKILSRRGLQLRLFDLTTNTKVGITIYTPLARHLFEVSGLYDSPDTD